MLDVPIDDRQVAEDDRQPARQRDQRKEERDRSPERRSRLGDEDQVHDDDDGQHGPERDDVGRDDGQRQNVAWEAHLLHERRLGEEARARHLHRGLEEDPGDKPGEDEERVVLDLERLQEHREDERVDRHQRQRVDERPDQPEDRAAVLPVQLAAEDVQEQVRVPDDVGVEAHDAASLGAAL